MEKIKATLKGSTISSNKKEAQQLCSKSCFGEPKSGKVYYSLVEALFLLENKKLELTEKSKKVTFEKLMQISEKSDKKIRIKYSVFRDMRKKGYIVKTALKFGAEYRVYGKGCRPGKGHAKWILYPVSESIRLTWHDFSAKSRVAHSTRKNLLIAVVDEELDITYYEISWMKP
ncbi:MAG: tRNA-intron lyase [archaeon]